MKKKLIHSILIIGILTMYQEIAKTQILDSAFTITGSIDVYFRNNLNSTNDPLNEGTLAPATSFANDVGFALGMANIVGAYEKGNIGFVTDIVFGPRGADAVFGSQPSENIINQMFGYWQVSKAVKLTLGNFNTFLGYEVISPAVNFNYSTSYNFSYGPFSHTGFKIDVDLGKGFSAMGGIFNPTDATENNPTGDYVGGAQLGYSHGILGAWVNTVFDDDFFQIDFTAGLQATEKLYLGLNATSASDNFKGVTTYIQYATSEQLAFGIRADYFVDEAGLALENIDTDDENVFGLTFTTNYTVGNLRLIPELRIDIFSNDGEILTDAIEETTSNKLSSFLLAAVFSF